MMASPALRVTSCDEDMNAEVRKLGYSTVATASPFFGPSRKAIQESLDKEFSVPQSLFVAEGLKLRALKPVAIRVSRGQDVWFAENERLDIYATGDSKEAAIQEFRLLLVRFYCHYRSLDAQRALKRARELKQLFEERFAEVEQ